MWCRKNFKIAERPNVGLLYNDGNGLTVNLDRTVPDQVHLVVSLRHYWLWSRHVYDAEVQR